MAGGRVCVGIDGAGLIVKLQAVGKTRLLESVTETVNLAVPAAVGVPEIVPVLVFNCRPTGSAPVNDQLW